MRKGNCFPAVWVGSPIRVPEDGKCPGRCFQAVMRLTGQMGFGIDRVSGFLGQSIRLPDFGGQWGQPVSSG